MIFFTFQGWVHRGPEGRAKSIQAMQQQKTLRDPSMWAPY